MEYKLKTSLDYAAEMTYNQFHAIASYIEYHDLSEELKSSNLNYNNAGSQKRFDKCYKMLFNSWSTEENLHRSELMAENELSGSILQWVFPMAYYSIFTMSSLFYYLNNYFPHRRISHKNIQKKFSELIIFGKYPQSISYFADGGKNNIAINNLVYNSTKNSIKYDSGNHEDVQRQIGQFLKSTREISLIEYREQNRKNFRTKTKQVKTNLSKDDWNNISRKIGATSLINLLYRKRIKGNYREIDTFLSESIKTKEIIEALLKIVDHLNTIHEYHILKLIGEQKFMQTIESYFKGTGDNFVKSRMEMYL